MPRTEATYGSTVKLPIRTQDSNIQNVLAVRPYHYGSRRDLFRTCTIRMQWLLPLLSSSPAEQLNVGLSAMQKAGPCAHVCKCLTSAQILDIVLLVSKGLI